MTIDVPSGLVPSGMAAGNQVTGSDQGGSLPGSAGSTPMPTGDELVALPKPDMPAQTTNIPRPNGSGPGQVS